MYWKWNGLLIFLTGVRWASRGRTGLYTLRLNATLGSTWVWEDRLARTGQYRWRRTTKATQSSGRVQLLRNNRHSTYQILSSRGIGGRRQSFSMHWTAPNSPSSWKYSCSRISLHFLVRLLFCSTPSCSGRTWYVSRHKAQVLHPWSKMHGRCTQLFSWPLSSTRCTIKAVNTPACTVLVNVNGSLQWFSSFQA